MAACSNRESNWHLLGVRASEELNGISEAAVRRVGCVGNSGSLANLPRRGEKNERSIAHADHTCTAVARALLGTAICTQVFVACAVLELVLLDHAWQINA